MNRMFRSLQIGALLIFGMAPRMVWPLEPFTETFTTGLGNWSNTQAIVWIPTNGQAQVTIPSSGGPPGAPQRATLQTAGSGPFVGNYRAADFDYVGLDFVFESSPPSKLRLLIEGGSAGAAILYEQEDFSAYTMGETNRIWISLASPAAGGWFPAGTDNFESALSFVFRFDIEIEVTSASVARTYRIDNIFLTRQPESRGDLTFGGEGEAVVRWASQNQMRYQMEASDDLILGEPGWEPASDVLTATGTQLAIPDPEAAEAPVRFYRLRRMP